MRNHGCISYLFGQFDGIKGFGDRSDLVQLDQDRVCDALFNAFIENLGVGHKNIIPDNLDGTFQSIGHNFPAIPIPFGKTIFNGENGILIYESFIIVDHLTRIELFIFGF